MKPKRRIVDVAALAEYETRHVEPKEPEPMATLADVAGGAAAVDRALRKNTPSASYQSDAEAIAKVMVRHYGDEAEAVLALAIKTLPVVRKAKR